MYSEKVVVVDVIVDDGNDDGNDEVMEALKKMNGRCER
jgi:hypothetical protein